MCRMELILPCSCTPHATCQEAGTTLTCANLVIGIVLQLKIKRKVQQSKGQTLFLVEVKGQGLFFILTEFDLFFILTEFDRIRSLEYRLYGSASPLLAIAIMIKFI